MTRLLAAVVCVAAAIACLATVAAAAESASPAAGTAKAKKKAPARRCGKSRRVRRAARTKAKNHSPKKRRRCRAKRKSLLRKTGGKRAPKAVPGRPNPLAGSPLGGAAPGPPLGRYLSVSAREFSLQLSRPALAAGQVTLELRNNGEDPHDLVLSPDDGSHTRLASFGETQPSDVATQSQTLSPGSYYLFCSLPRHESFGMYAHLKVR
jgi:hypothetical protein